MRLESRHFSTLTTSYHPIPLYHACTQRYSDINNIFVKTRPLQTSHHVTSNSIRGALFDDSSRYKSTATSYEGQDTTLHTNECESDNAPDAQWAGTKHEGEKYKLARLIRNEMIEPEMGWEVHNEWKTTMESN